MKMRMFRCLAVLVQVVAVLLLSSGMARAQCNLGNQGTQQAQITLTPSTVSIPRDAPVGTVLAQGTQTFSFSNTSYFGVWCSTSASGSYTSPYGFSSGGIIPSGVPGLGFQIDHGGVSNQDTTTFSIAQSQFAVNGNTGYVSLGSPVTIRLVKTGPISGAVYSPAGLVLTMTVNGLQAATATVNNSVFVTGLTCSVTTPQLTVTLPTVPLTDFGAVGSTAGQTAFQIGLNCRGMTGNLGITFTDSTDPSNRTTTLSLAPSSTATGVGIQILSSGTPVTYGPDSSVVGNPGQIMLGKNEGLLNLSFNARYVKTASNATPGKVNGIATFTLTYQ